MEKEIELNAHNKQEYPPMHTAEHIINRTMDNMFRCGRAIDAHIEKKKSKMDFAIAQKPTDDDIALVEATVNDIIDRHLTVSSRYISQSEASELFDLARLPQNASDAVRVVSVGD